MYPHSKRTETKNNAFIKKHFLFTLLIFTFTACGQYKNNRLRLGRAYAEKELNAALTDKSQHGTLPKGYIGGTFLLIMDASNCKIMRLTHGK